MKSDLHSLFPKIYNGILETDILADVGDVQFNEYFLHMDDARRNQFVLTSDMKGIEAFERIYEIKADPVTEDLEFRRQRLLNRMRMKIPFTFRFLLQRLDDLIGPGKYKAWLGKGNWQYRLGSWRLGEKTFRDAEYTLYVEATATDIHWHQEVQIFINKIKPANIVYSLSPLVAEGLLIAETISTAPRTWNYRLGNWKLGRKPFLTDMVDKVVGWNYKLGKWKLENIPFGIEAATEVIKLPETPSIQSTFLNGHARYTAMEIAVVRLNGEFLISDINKRTDGGTATLRYIVTPASGLQEITLIELLNESDDILDSARVYVPVPAADQLSFIHTITHKEGVSNG